MIFTCERAEVFKFADESLHSTAVLVANKGSLQQRILTITGPGIKFKNMETYDLDLQVNGIDWDECPDYELKEISRNIL